MIPNFDELLESITNVFVNEEKFGFDKHIWEYKPDGKYIGDSVAMTMAESTSPPTFYYVISPYDDVSKKAPQQAFVFKDGELLLSVDYTDFAAMRTGAMDALVLQSLGISSLDDQKILMFGKGKTANWSRKFLEHVYGNDVDITTAHSQTPKNSYDIGKFDIIICHTNAKEFVLKAEDISKVKKGAIITNFISSATNTEVAPSFFDFEKANIVIDWEPNLARAPEIKKDTNLIELKEILAKKKKLDEKKDYTIFRFLGTPLQNLAVLKILI